MLHVYLWTTRPLLAALLHKLCPQAPSPEALHLPVYHPREFLQQIAVLQDSRLDYH